MRRRFGGLVSLASVAELAEQAAGSGDGPAGADRANEYQPAPVGGGVAWEG